MAGAEVALERLAAGLRESGIEVLCVVGTKGELLERLQGQGFNACHIQTYFTGWKTAWGYYRSQHALRRLWAQWRPTIIHSNDLPSHQLVSDAARGLRIPRICHHRWYFDPQAIDWFNKYGAERHLFVSDALLQTLTNGSQTLALAPQMVVYDGLPLGSVPDEPARGAAKRDLGLDASKATLLFAGQIIERKGVADLIHAWTMLQDKWGDRAELVIVGDDLEQQGAYRRKMEQLATDRGCNVRFVGFQKNVPLWLTAADIVLVPSHAEPLGNAVLEAMAHARPVISSSVGGLPEMTLDKVTGLLTPARSPRELAAAMESLLSDRAWREQLGRAARQRCEDRFSISSHVSEMLTQYRKTLKPSGND